MTMTPYKKVIKQKLDITETKNSCREYLLYIN